jgi:hypothetical protein
MDYTKILTCNKAQKGLCLLFEQRGKEFGWIVVGNLVRRRLQGSETRTRSAISMHILSGLEEVGFKIART